MLWVHSIFLIVDDVPLIWDVICEYGGGAYLGITQPFYFKEGGGGGYDDEAASYYIK